MNLSVAGQTIVLPLYVEPDRRPGRGTRRVQADDLPAAAGCARRNTGTLIPGRTGPRREVHREQDLHDADGRRSPEVGDPVHAVQRRKLTPNAAGTFEARALVPIPILLGLKAGYVKKTNTWKLSGKASEGGTGAAGVAIKIARGTSAKSLGAKSSTTTSSTGTWSTAGHLKPKKTTYFQGERHGRRARRHGSGAARARCPHVRARPAASARRSRPGRRRASSSGSRSRSSARTVEGRALALPCRA